jgi:4-amino-4-deoxy-L-arabinose transferase-like glycosyltransferase
MVTFSNFYNRLSQSLLTVLICSIAFRGLTLSYMDLLDPSESRYAMVAATMYKSHNWVLPVIPSIDGDMLFLSKPPLHYWLTALSYKFFGISEWTSRLPSFLAFLLTFLALGWAERTELKRALIACTVLALSPLAFSLFGASTLDATLTGALTCALVAYKSYFTTDRRHVKITSFFIFWISLSVGFLIKGPLILVLAAFPICFFWYYTHARVFFSVKTILYGIIILVSLITPWFVLLEIHSPGSFYYMFVNENFLRFVAKKYGDRYGTGHTRPWGSIWWMYALATLPSLLLLLKSPVRKELALLTRLFLTKPKKAHIEGKNEEWIVYYLAWALAPGVFFTFAKQVLPAYVLPGLPGFALVVGYVINKLRKRDVLLFSDRTMVNLGVSTCVFFLVLQLIGGSYLSGSKSAKGILREIALADPLPTLSIGVYSTENLSPFWLATAGNKLLPEPTVPHFVTPEEVRNCVFTNLLVRKNKDGSIQVGNILDRYVQRLQKGRWAWYVKQNCD